MDPLTHVFLPLTVVYVAFRDRFPSPRYLLLGGFAVAPDFDKLLGVPGLFHSLLTVLPVCAAFVAFDRWWRDDLPVGTIAAAFVLSHLFLDFLDGSGAYLLYPLVDAGVGLSFPLAVTFGEGLLGFRFEGPLVVLERPSAPTGFAESSAVDRNSFGFLAPYGVASATTFLAVLGTEWLRDGQVVGQRDD